MFLINNFLTNKKVISSLKNENLNWPNKYIKF